jgi:hypothetical protein
MLSFGSCALGIPLRREGAVARTKSQPRSNQEFIEANYDGVDEIRELMKNWKNRFTCDNPRVSERYLKGELRVLVEIKSLVPLGNTIKLCAVLQRERQITRDRDGNDLLFRGQVNPDHRRFVTHADYEEKSVLVKIIEGMQHEQIIVPSVIRLERVDHLFSLWSDSLYISSRKGFVCLGTLIDREANPSASRDAVIGQNQLPNQMVKSGPQVLEDVADNGGEVCRNIFSDKNPPDQIIGLRVFLSDRGVRIGFEKGFQSTVEITDVLLGPLDFTPNNKGPIVHK